MSKKIAAVLFAWFVVSYSGARLSGPFTFVNECQAAAQEMARHRSDVSTVCRSFSD